MLQDYNYEALGNAMITTKVVILAKSYIRTVTQMIPNIYIFLSNKLEIDYIKIITDLYAPINIHKIWYLLKTREIEKKSSQKKSVGT